MPTFHIKAYYDGQGVVDRQIDASSPNEARAAVIASGGRVLSLSAEKTLLEWHGSRPARFDYTQFAQELHSLLEAGLSVSRALESLGNFRTGTNGATVIRCMLDELQRGKSMSQALAAVEPPAPTLLISLIAASEHTGNLVTALSRYVAYRERMDGIRKRLTTAMLYPTLLTAVGGLVIIFLLGFVIPRFAKAYDHMSGDVPFASRLIIEWGALLRHHGALVALIFVIVFAVLALKVRANFRTRGIAAFLGFSENAKRRLRDYELSRFYRTLGLQLLGGIAIIPAMESAGILLRASDRPALIKATERLQQGVSVSAAVDEAGLSSPLVMDLIRVGEQSGELGAVMIRIADFLDESVARWMEAFTRLFEPILMLGLGIIIACIVVLLYLPVFDLADNIR